MKVLIDHREKSIVSLVKNACECEIVQLPIGDLLVAGDEGALVVERKTASDFVSSMRSNRLWDQLLRLMKVEEVCGYEVKRRLLVIQGSLLEYANVASFDHQKFWGSIFGALLEILFVYDTPVVLCENTDAFEAFFRILIKREEDGRDDGLPKARWYRKPLTQLPTKHEKHYLLDTIPLIGEKHAKSLLDHYVSISNIANATQDELMIVPGIGKKRAEKIYQIFH